MLLLLEKYNEFIQNYSKENEALQKQIDFNKKSVELFKTLSQKIDITKLRESFSDKNLEFEAKHMLLITEKLHLTLDVTALPNSKCYNIYNVNDMKSLVNELLYDISEKLGITNAQQSFTFKGNYITLTLIYK